MSRYSALSPQTRLAPALRIFPASDEKDFLIQSLQSKLQTLETKYSQFIEKCSGILKSEELKTEARDYFSECSSSVRFSPDPAPITSLEEHESLVKLLKEISEGIFVKQHMNDISTLTEKVQNSLLQSLKSSTLNPDLLKSSLQLLKRNLWEVLIQKEDLVKIAVQGCLHRFREFDKLLEESLKSMKIERKLKEYKEKFLKTQDENLNLLQKIKEQNDCLLRIKDDYHNLKKKLLISSPKVLSPSSRLQLYETLPRSESSSPHQSETQLKRLKETNLNLHSRLKLLSYQNTIFQQVKRSASGSDPKESYEFGKKEIQGQLRALQRKLTGFEKIAKNLIDSSIRAELQSIGQGNIKEPFLKRNKDPDDSLPHTPLSLLEYDQVLRNLENTEKEKIFLAENLKKEQEKNQELSDLICENEKKYCKVNEEFVVLQRKFQDNFGMLSKCLDEKDELEVLIRDFKEIQKELEEQKKDLEGKIKSLEEEIRTLNLKIKLTEEEKAKTLNLLAKHRENEKRLEENLKKWGEDYTKMQEMINTTKNFEKTQEISQITLKFTRKLEEYEIKQKETSENEQKLIKDSKSLQETLEKYSTENQELSEKLKNNEIQKASLNEELENLSKLLENTQKKYKKVKSELDELKQSSEKRISEKNKIISSFELKNHENFQLTCEISEFEKKVEALKSQNFELSAENELLTQKIKDLNEINSSKEKIIEDYENQNKKTSEKFRVLTDNLQEFQRMMKENSIKLKISEENNSKLQVSFEKVQERLESYLEKQKIDENKIKNLEKTINSQSHQISSLQSQLSKTEENKIQLLSQLEEKDFLINSLHSEVKSLEVQISSQEILKQELEKDISILNKKIKNLEETLEKKEDSIFSYEKTLNDLRSLNETLIIKSNDQDLRKKLTEAQRDLQLKQSELEKKEAESKTLQNSLESNEESIIKLQTDLNQCKVRAETLEKQLNLKGNEVIEMKLKITQLERKDLENQTQINSVKFQLEESKTIQDETLAALSEKEVIIEELENQLTSQLKDHEQSKNEIIQLKKTLKDLNSSLETTKNSSSVQLSQLQNHIKQLETQLKANETLASTRLEKLQKKKSKLRSLQEEKHAKLLKTKENSNFTSKTLFFKFNQLKLSLAEVKRSIKSKLLDFEKSSELSEILIAVTSKLTLMNAVHSNSLSVLKSEKDFLMEKLKSLNEKIQDLSKQLEFKQKELEHMVVESVSLKGKLSSFETENSRLQKTEVQNQELIDRLNNSLVKVNSLKSNNTDLVSELERVKRVNFETSSQNERLSLLINRLQSDNQQLKTDLEVYSIKLIEKTKQIEILSEKQETIKIEQVDTKEYEKQIKIKKQELHQMHQESQTLQKKIEEKNKIIEELSKNCNLLKFENEKITREQKNIGSELQKCKENLEDKDLTVKKLNDTVIDLEKLLQNSQRNEEELKNILSKQDSSNLKTFQSNDGLPPRPEKLFQNRQSVSTLAPPVTLSPGFSKGSSFHLNFEPSRKASQESEDMNVASCKVVKVVKVQDKKWVLCLDDEGDYIWKNETGLHISGAENLLEAEEDFDEIKAALGDHFKGSVVEAINFMREKIENLEFSVHLNPDDKVEVASHSFQGELFDVGLDFSKIELKIQDHQDYEKVTDELNKRYSEVNEKNKKIEEKKRKLSLYKEQITVLKEQMRRETEEKKEIEDKLKSTLGVDLSYLKQLFTSLVSKLKTDKNIEDLVNVMFKVLDFSTEEVSRVQNVRKGGKMMKN